jgi:hypothetical protein
VYDHPNPYTARQNWYAPEKKRLATLAEEFIKDMLDVTGGGRARDFEGVRDHASSESSPSSAAAGSTPPPSSHRSCWLRTRNIRTP